jgi:predicted flap endonuclease-1-like 5' DNA nuclease
MENTEKKIVATIKSPTRGVGYREGSGFSLAEIAASGKSIVQIKNLKLKIDYFRKSAHKENIELLKTVKITEKKGKKKKGYVPKEKRDKIKPKIKKKTPEKTELPPAEEPIIEKKQKVKASSPKKIKVKKPEKEAEIEEIPLTSLSGLGPATAQKFIDVGVKSVEQLCEEVPEELAQLIPGCSEDKISKWVEEGKKLLDK